MTLQDIFDQLESGEFSHLGILGDDGKLEASSYPKTINNINLALTNIYSRFNLSTKEVVIKLRNAKSTYDLRVNYSGNELYAPKPDYVYGKEGNTYVNDVLKILEVYNECGEKFLLNEEDSDCKLFTPSPTVLQVDTVIQDAMLFVIYDAGHFKIPTVIDTETVPAANALFLELPDAFLQAVLYYVAYRIHMNRLKEGSAVMAAQMKNLYEQECNQLDTWGLTNSDTMAGKSAYIVATEGWV
jgi:hypothetical protein